MATNRIKNQHLLWRAGFGPMAENLAQLDTISQKTLWQLLVKTSSKKPEKLEVAKGLVDGLTKGIGQIAKMENSSQEEKKEVQRQKRKQFREELSSLNMLWFDNMINSEAQLREKMSFFWHGHFATRVINSFFQQELLHIIRENALGSFADLLRAVSKSPTMLQFLNNQQNRKSHPNENFAREVMELFTMGRGHYTENDIKEAARAFTGWGFNAQGEFVFRKQFHDEGEKTVLGQKGNFNGDDIIDILLDRPETAYYITKKIYRYFVNENTDEAKVKWLAERFQKSRYQILPLLEDIFTSGWFYEEKNTGNKIKSPIELLAGIRRYLPMELDNENAQLLFQKVLGQVLFFPPNVAGWPGGRAWIDSSSLMVRLQIPQVLAAKESISLSPKGDDDVSMGKMEEMLRAGKNKQYIKRGASADIDWNPVIKIFEAVKREDLVTAITNTLMQTKSRVTPALLAKYLDAASRETYIKTAVINVMSTPEYQLC
ncbi:MAG: DUF1800 domain-containing protein [Ferruginibacter sp.]